MKKFIFLALEVLLLVFFLPYAFAEQILKNPIPLNGSYISCGSDYLFSVDIYITNFNSCEASKLSMKCYQVNSSFRKCNTTVLISLAASGTKEFYYYEKLEDLLGKEKAVWKKFADEFNQLTGGKK